MPPDPEGGRLLRQRLQEGLQSLGLAPPAGQVDALLAYQALIERWNRVYNLTAVRDPQEMLTQHLLDSAAVVPALQAHLSASAPAPATAGPRRLLDVGSGPGLPGVVVAVLMPGLEVTCVDAVAKKASFIRQVAAELALPNLHAVHARVERMPSSPRFDIVVSRAFASLADFVRLTRERLAERGVWVAMKGRPPEEELAGLEGVRLLRVQALCVPGMDAQRCLVWMSPA